MWWGSGGNALSARKILRKEVGVAKSHSPDENHENRKATEELTGNSNILGSDAVRGNKIKGPAMNETKMVSTLAKEIGIQSDGKTKEKAGMKEQDDIKRGDLNMTTKFNCREDNGYDVAGINKLSSLDGGDGWAEMVYDKEN
ncbi:hypothetical protein ACH5RR_032385 [Cinchona calisaya]|uniref:Uncharacterized protein n=1 Tax=Cinchona calisaya TaxID=153742 RepID=A0ABD2YN79_9GENT